jgi:hypothetical protein
MRLTLMIFLSCIYLFLTAGNSGYYYSNFFSPPDTMPPPPQGEPSPLSGPAFACVGDMSEYAIDVPVSCTCQWSVNSVIQSETSSPLTITWTQPGVKVVSVVFYCENGEISDPQTVSTDVFQTPEPQPISGDDPVCEYTYHTYSTVVGPLDSCQWTVNGVIQPGYLPAITYSFGASGIYQFEVIAFNPCGTSSPQTLEVTAQGSAPAPPSPVQGPEESCEGNTDTYTTTVGAGESCAWWIDGVQQSSTSTTLLVTWSEWGDHVIEVRAVSNCGTGNPAVKNVLVLYQPWVFLGNDTTILQGHTLVLDAGNPGSDYLWSTGAVTQTIPVSISGIYRVNVSNFCGADADTINVSVIVGINETFNPAGCFDVILNQRRITLLNLPQGAINIQVINLTGMACYDGPAEGEINVSLAGIYLIRVTSAEKTCCKKLFIP